MFFELSQHKLLVVCIILVMIVFGVGIFMVADNALSFVAQAESYVSMQQSSFWYWLLFELPNGGQFAAAALPEGSAHSVPVLLYHGEGATSNMPLATFVDQMRALKADGWHTITMAQFQAFVQHGTPLPAKSFLLTFDDGRKDTYYQADPVLKDMGFNAVMFVITGFSLPTTGKESTFYLNKTELSDMIATGRWQLESHGDLDHSTYAVQTTTDLSQTASTTDGHFLSNKFWSTDVNRFETNAEFTARVTGDLQTSKQTLEQDFNISVNAFAYPFNDFGQDSVNFPDSERILDQVVPSIYQFTFYQTWVDNGDTFNYPLINNGPGRSAYMEKRIEPLASWSGDDVVAALNAGSAKPLPYASTTFGQEWVGTWGLVNASGNALTLSAKPSTSGASVFLNGSGWWTDYMESATVDMQKGAISLVARNQDDAHYVSCTFDQGGVVIEQHDNAEHTTLGSGDASVGPGTVTIGMAVYGNRATCYAAGAPIVSASIGAGLRQGGVGFEIWNAQLGTARSVVEQFSVRALSAPPIEHVAVRNPQPAFTSPFIPIPQTPVQPAPQIPQPLQPVSPVQPQPVQPAPTSTPPAVATTTATSSAHALPPTTDPFMKTHRHRGKSDQ